MAKFNTDGVNTLDEIRSLANQYGAKCTLIKFDKHPVTGISNPQKIKVNAKIAYSHMVKPNLANRPRSYRYLRTLDQYTTNPQVQAERQDLNSLSSADLLEAGFVRADQVKELTPAEMIEKLKAEGHISGNVKLKTETENE